jgi:hypothetical protein
LELSSPSYLPPLHSLSPAEAHRHLAEEKPSPESSSYSSRSSLAEVEVVVNITIPLLSLWLANSSSTPRSHPSLSCLLRHAVDIDIADPLQKLTATTMIPP